MVYKLITAPTELSITLAEAKAQMNIDNLFTGDDTLITSDIHAATLHIEKIIQSPIMAQTWELQLTDFVDTFKIHKTPVASITSLKYDDISNAEQTVDSSEYQTDLSSVPARVILNSGYSSPSVYDKFDAVRLRFVSGYVDATAVPQDLKKWIKVLVTQFYQFKDYSVKKETEDLIIRNLMRSAAWL